MESMNGGYAFTRDLFSSEAKYCGQADRKTGDRDASLEPDPRDWKQILFLNEKVLDALDRLGLPRNPGAISGAATP